MSDNRGDDSSLEGDANKGTDSYVLFQCECVGASKHPEITRNVIICNNMRAVPIFPISENHHTFT